MDTVNHENQPIRIAFDVSHGRVQHYSDIVEYMARDAIENYRQKYNKMPAQQQIQFLKKELTRYAVIRRDLDTASKLRIHESNILNEQDYSLHSRI